MFSDPNEGLGASYFFFFLRSQPSDKDTEKKVNLKLALTTAVLVAG